MVLNYPKKEMHIIPNNNFSDRFDYAYTGLSLYNFDGKIYADDIIEKSPADKAGLKNGDEVISVGSNISGNIQEYENILQKVRERTLLIIKRDNKPYLISIFPVSIR